MYVGLLGPADSLLLLDLPCLVFLVSACFGCGYCSVIRGNERKLLRSTGSEDGRIFLYMQT